MLAIAFLFLGYTVVGVLLFYHNRRSIIIANRLPHFVYIEVLLGFSIQACNYLRATELMDTYYCHFLYGFYGSFVCLFVLLNICRTTYLYRFIMGNNENNLIWMIFWKNNKLERIRLAVVSTILLVGIWLNAFQQILFNFHKFSSICNRSNVDFAFFLYILMTILHVCISFDLLFKKVFDKIGLFYELFSVNCLNLIMNLIMMVAIGIFSDIAVFATCLLYSTSSLYFPLGVLFFHSSKLSKSMVLLTGESKRATKLDLVNDSRVYDLCKRFLCEENAKYLLSYSQYTEGSMTLDQIIALHFLSGSPFELNISEALRLSIVKSNQVLEVIQISLAKVNQEVQIMIKENIVPYLDDDNT